MDTITGYGRRPEPLSCRAPPPMPHKCWRPVEGLQGKASTGRERVLTRVRSCGGFSVVGMYWGVWGVQAETCWSCSALVRAASSTARQEAFGRRRSSARRSRSVMPPHTPHSIWLSSASARHSVRTGQPVHSCLALFCSAPRTKSSSGCACRHAARGVQSSIHICLPCHLRDEEEFPVAQQFLGSFPGARASLPVA